jgi:Flp pilus assembly protein TadD
VLTPRPAVVAPRRTTSGRTTRTTSAQARRAEKERLFNHYSSLAYDALNRRQYAQFLRYSEYALDTGLSSSQLYYDRGYVLESLGDFEAARKEYIKADRMGYAPARYALSELERKMRSWRY